MATFRKRSGSWQAQVRVAGGLQSKTFGSKAEAKLWAATVELALADPSNIKSAHCAVDVLIKYLDEITPTKANPDNERIVLEAMMRHEWTQIPLHKLTSSDLVRFRNLRNRQASPSTFNTQWAIVKSAMAVARNDWKWDVPLELFVSLKLHRVVDRDVPRITNQQVQKLLEAADTSRNNYIKPMMILALETGMRRGETLQMTWSMIDLETGWIKLPGRITKSNKSRQIPISPKAESALLEIKALKEKGKLVNRRNVFVDTDVWEERVLPITKESLRACWERVRAKAGLNHLHWHDWRHEAISRLFELGLTVPEVQSISGHATIDQLQRYSHPAASSIFAKVRGGQV